ncbi:MAG: Uncharacterised protein [Bacteroidia bacterium]|nr:MAG: Uncharacterised protein [Bacteroidia bacterium]
MLCCMFSSNAIVKFLPPEKVIVCAFEAKTPKDNRQIIAVFLKKGDLVFIK